MLRGISINTEQCQEIVDGIVSVLSEDPDLEFDVPLRLDRSLEVWTSTAQDFNRTVFIHHHLENPGVGAVSLGEKDEFRIVKAGIGLATQQRIAEALGSLDQRDGEVRLLTIPHLHLETLLVDEDSGSRFVVVIRGLRQQHRALFGRELRVEKFLRFVQQAPSLAGIGHHAVGDFPRDALKLLV